jgi:hypothetical protein
METEQLLNEIVDGSQLALPALYELEGVQFADNVNQSDASELIHYFTRAEQSGKKSWLNDDKSKIDHISVGSSSEHTTQPTIPYNVLYGTITPAERLNRKCTTQILCHLNHRHTVKINRALVFVASSAREEFKNLLRPSLEHPHQGSDRLLASFTAEYKMPNAALQFGHLIHTGWQQNKVNQELGRKIHLVEYRIFLRDQFYLCCRDKVTYVRTCKDVVHEECKEPCS